MTWIVILLIIAFLISNLFWLMPSREERRRMKLRQKAYENKFKVQENFEQTHEGRWFDYVLVKKHELESVVYISSSDGWSTAKGNNAIPSILETLPVGVAEVSVKLGQISICWNEQGTPADVEKLISVAQELAKGADS